MDAGFGLLGFGLFLFAISNFYARVGQPLAWVVFLLSLVAMGYTFSEKGTGTRRMVALGLAVAMAVLAILGIVVRVPAWSWLLSFGFAVGFTLLWAEFRFPFFEQLGEEQVVVRHDERGKPFMAHRHEREPGKPAEPEERY